MDVHYRDLDVVEHELAEAEEGRFHVEPLLFHLAGIPSYLIVAELAVNQVLRGSLPTCRPTRTSSAHRPRPLARSRPHDPRLRRYQPRPERPPHRGRGRHRHSRDAGRAHGARGVGGEWVMNEKRLLERAGLRGVDDIIGDLRPDPRELTRALAEAEALFDSAISAVEATLTE